MNPLLIRRRGMLNIQPSPQYTPDDYVQSGLEHMWDGEWNNGRNDHSQTPIVWKDLIGADDLTLSPNVVVGGKYFQNTINSDYIAYRNASYVPKTIQFCFKRDSFDTTLTTFVLSARISTTRYAGNFHFNFGNLGYLYFESSGNLTNRRGVPIATTDMGVHSISASWSSATAIASLGYDNMQYTMVSNLSGTGRNGSTFFLVGNSVTNGGTNYALLGKVFCIRLYNRVLTADEIISNQQIDLQRFS